MVSQKVVIPAQAGIRATITGYKYWIPVFTGMTKW
jgi:hypothetical protein